MLPKGMTVSQLLFKTEGRIPRSTLWLRFLLPVWVLSIVVVVIDFSTGLMDEETGIGVFSGLFTLLILYPSIAVLIKRLHDRNRSGWFYLLFLVPLVNIWLAVECYFLRGTAGDNQYGEDPLSSTNKAIRES